MFTLVSVCRRKSLVIPDKTKRLIHKGLVFGCLSLSTNSCYIRQRLVYKLQREVRNRVRQHIHSLNEVLYREIVVRMYPLIITKAQFIRVTIITGARKVCRKPCFLLDNPVLLQKNVYE